MKILKITPHSAKTLIWWYNHRSDIDFDPPYQRRGRLWSAQDKAYLIDTIINGFDVPKLYLADFQFGQSGLNSAKKPYAIIDGKQRLEAIFDFFENKITLDSEFRFRKDPDLKIGGLSLRDLKKSHSKVAEEFENASLDIMSVVAEDEADINEIFVRLNKSKPLTGAEVRNAVSGPVSELIRIVASHQFFIENIRFSPKRAADLNAAAKILYFEYSGGPVATKKTNLDEFTETSSGGEHLELSGRRALDTLSIMSEIFIPKDTLLSSSGIIPVYYWFIRDIERNKIEYVREFLVYFDSLRTSNRDKQKKNVEERLDQSLARFDALNRSTNDQQSHSGRISILKEFFRDWVRG